MVSGSPHRINRSNRILIAGLAGLATAVLWVSVGLAALAEATRLQSEAQLSLEASASALAAAVGQQVDDGRLALDLLARQVRAHPDEIAETSPEFLSLVEGLRHHAAGELDVRGVDSRGFLYYFDGDGSERQTWVGDRDYFLRQMPWPGSGPFIDQPVQSRHTGRWGLVLSGALPPHAGSLAVVTVVYEFEDLDATVDRSLVDPRIDVHLFRPDGRLLFAHPEREGFPQQAVVDPAMSDLVGEWGRVPGRPFQAFHRVDNLPLLVVVSGQALAAAANPWELLQKNLGWVLLVTLVLGLAGVLLWVNQTRLERLLHEVGELARVDPLTGLLNRRAFLERVNAELAWARREGEDLTLVLFDLDHFKQINDRWGHLEGDRVLREFAEALGTILRASDLTARTGGEEFAVVLPGVGGRAAWDTAERIRQAAEQVRLSASDPRVGHASVSAGVAGWSGDETFDQWYHRADQALYRAKARGRNRCELATLEGYGPDGDGLVDPGEEGFGRA